MGVKIQPRKGNIAYGRFFYFKAILITLVSKKRPSTRQACQGKCIVSVDLDAEVGAPEICEDKNKVAYCPLVKKFNFCERPYFRKMCCKTCKGIM